MKFGMFFPMQLPRPWAEASEQSLFRRSLEYAELGEQIGVEYAWAQEHHFLEEYSHSTAPEVFLAALSQRTSRMRLGHGVTLMPPAINHPARIAERIATLDLVSEGRVEWGTGESSSRIELEGFGINYIEKRAMWAEAVRETARMIAATPYPGHEGRYFSMPPRNIVPKPAQRPHPPMWVACTNRDTMRLAARLGLGALTFSFMDIGEARFWVEEYYEIFKNECTPIARAVNPNVAMLQGVMCHEDHDTAITRGLDGLRFFAFGLAHYYRFGRHVPGHSDLWRAFEQAPVAPVAGQEGIGCPERVAESFASLEEAGVDQLILLHQAGNYRHEHIVESLELFGDRVIGDFIRRDADRQQKKQAELAPYIDKALAKIPPIDESPPPVVESYPVLWGQEGIDEHHGPRRSLEGAAVWRMHVGGLDE